MSVSYSGKYEIKIRAKKEDLPKIREAVEKVRDDGGKRDPEDWSRMYYLPYYHDEFSKMMIDEIEAAERSNEDPAILTIRYGIVDDTHGFIHEYLYPIQEAAPEIEVAFKVELYFDEGKNTVYGYKRTDDAPLDIGVEDFYGFGFSNRKTIFQKDADWIPWKSKSRKSSKGRKSS